MATKPKIFAETTCPICQVTFVPKHALQETCGVGKCPKKWWNVKPQLCDCKQAFRVARNKGCAECEAKDARYAAAVAESEARRLARQRQELADAQDMVAFAKRWNRTHREFENVFNAYEGSKAA